ncbi:MAG: hypothetical protein OXI87_22025 [Albidovulum sp.]|nr:hypothetical protein [Albidovulum sp.]MDE0530205.1 hypothetical protein [Albidovulum sp.]
MQIRFLIPAVFSSMMLAISGCSFENGRAQEEIADYYISEISVDVSEGIELRSLQPQDEEELMQDPPLVAGMLAQAIELQVAESPAGTRPASISVVLEKLRVARLGDETIGGVSELTGSVAVSDSETGEVIATTSIVAHDGDKDEVLDGIGGILAVMVVAPVAVLLNSVDEGASAELQPVVDSFAENVGVWLGA